jgi:hypothetical protein
MPRILWLALLVISACSAAPVLHSFQQPEPRPAAEAPASKPTTTKVWIGYGA